MLDIKMYDVSQHSSPLFLAAGALLSSPWITVQQAELEDVMVGSAAGGFLRSLFSQRPAFAVCAVAP